MRQGKRMDREIVSSHEYEVPGGYMHLTVLRNGTACFDFDCDEADLGVELTPGQVERVRRQLEQEE